MDKDRTEFFDCICYDQSHAVRFSLMGDGKDAEVYMSYFLNAERGFFRRLWEGIKYTFAVGKPCQYGHFGSWTLRPEDSKRLASFLKEYDKRVKA